jgi:hypothetical protein
MEILIVSSLDGRNRARDFLEGKSSASQKAGRNRSLHHLNSRGHFHPLTTRGQHQHTLLSFPSSPSFSATILDLLRSDIEFDRLGRHDRPAAAWNNTASSLRRPTIETSR